MGKCVEAIELRHLCYFVTAAEHGSFRKAAAVLETQESTISRRVRDLEDRIGASLFHRHSGGVFLTLAGERYLRHARRILRQVRESVTEAVIVGRSEEGRVRMGIFSSLASGFLPDLMRAYDRRHANVQIELVDGNPAEHVAAIRQLQLDVAFLTGKRDWPGCDATPLWSERVFVVLPQSHDLAAKEELHWPELAHEMFIVSEVAPGQEIHDYLVQRLADLGHHPEIQPQYVGRDNLLPLVALGRGLTLTSQATTAAQFPGVCYRPIAGESLPFSAVWSPKNDNPAFRRLLSIAKAMSKGRMTIND
ncbi:LysR family transcriptional regulator [Rhizobium lentis]|uniref:LysR substrate-binding domain-containing protein n=1 Tax=Rhizobium lentis TaxID=1138194 RepID=UPI001C82F54C|nr:LysR family transcriptional regulator [Rhizobium lentis]MBX5141264.1 LysR family transcriptional regulator [Rhizobium lentis]